MKIFVLFLLFISYFSHASFGQDTKDTIPRWHSKNVIKTNLLLYFSHVRSFTYERVVGDKSSALITYGNGNTAITSGEAAKKDYLDRYGVIVYNNYIPGNTEHTTKVNSILGFEFRFYFSDKTALPPAGFHIGPSLSFLSFNEKFIFYDDQGTEMDRKENKYNVTSININIGPQFLIHRLVAIELSLAPGYGIATIKESSSNSTTADDLKGTGLLIGYGINVGLTF